MLLDEFNLKTALKNSKLRGGWEIIDDVGFQKRLNNELVKEVDVGHELYGIELNAIFRNMDDVVYQFVGSEKVASVHLTCCQGKDMPPFPLSSIYECLDDWYEQEYLPRLWWLPENLTHFAEVVIAYAIELISDTDFENFIYQSSKDDMPFNDNDYLDLISANFKNKTEIMLILNRWYRKEFNEDLLYLNRIYTRY